MDYKINNVIFLVPNIERFHKHVQEFSLGCDAKEDIIKYLTL
jgi:hypothetical protein